MVLTTLGRRVLETSTLVFFFVHVGAIFTASAAAVGPSYIEALLTSRPVSAQIMLWYSKIYLRVPWEISA